MQREQEQQSREFWERTAGAGAAEGELAGLLSPDARLAQYRDAAEKAVLLARHGGLLHENARVLEVACGGGRWTTWLAQRCRHVVATDISANMIELAGRAVHAAGASNVELITASMEQLDAPGPFDLVYLGCCLQYMSEEAIDEGLAKVAERLAPGAPVLSRDSVSMIGRAFRRSEHYAGDDPAIYRPAAWYAERFARIGLAPVDAWPTYVKPLSWRLRKLLPDPVLERGLRGELGIAAGEVRAAWLLHRAGAKDHRFFLYAKPA